MSSPSKAHEYFMSAALTEAKRSASEGNQGVGAVITRDGHIVARGRNLQNSTNDPTTHAETVAIQNFSKTHQNIDFSGTVLYTTFEPCPMCCGAILTSGTTTLVMGGRPSRQSTQWGDYTPERLIELTGRAEKIVVITGVMVQECNMARA